MIECCYPLCSADTKLDSCKWMETSWKKHGTCNFVREKRGCPDHATLKHRNNILFNWFFFHINSLRQLLFQLSLVFVPFKRTQKSAEKLLWLQQKSDFILLSKNRGFKCYCNCTLQTTNIFILKYSKQNVRRHWSIAVYKWKPEK